MATAPSPLTRCPVCRYSLVGLPHNHRCPECGFAYDETMRVWWMPAVPGWVFGFAWSVPAAVLMTWCSGWLRGWFGWTYAEIFAAVVIVSGLIPLGGLFFARGFVATGRSGLTYRFPFRPARSLPWNEIQVGGRRHTISRVRDGLILPLRLPTVGLPRRRRKAIHAEIARRRQEAMQAGT